LKHSPQWFEASVRRIRDLSPSVREFELLPHVGVQSWSVGSHLCVQVEASGRSDVRSYSLTGLPGGGAYRIAVKRVDPSRGGSAFMWRLREGDTLPIQHPNNHFELSLGAPQTLLVAGGIGITPIVGMAQTLAARAGDVTMCYAARNDAELVYLGELRDALGERLRTFVTARGERLDFDTEIAALQPQAQVLVCGPMSMLHAAQAAWARSGRPAHSLRFETFGSSGALPAETFWVRLPRHQLQIEVPPESTLLEALEAHGIETLFDCRRGECGLCAMDILSLEGTLDHRDVFFSEQEKQQGQRLCACVSRISGGGVVLDSAWRPDT
jgi:ferredoxin-NADP reductase